MIPDKETYEEHILGVLTSNCNYRQNGEQGFELEDPAAAASCCRQLAAAAGDG